MQVFANGKRNSSSPWHFNFLNLYFNAKLEGKKLSTLLLKCCLEITTITYSEILFSVSKRASSERNKETVLFYQFCCSLIVDNSCSKQTRQITC